MCSNDINIVNTVYIYIEGVGVEADHQEATQPAL